jgi:LysR family nitrogen assimilation transcriptional regulator
MELRQLNYFLAVVKAGSFSKAASVLGIAQPALSRQIRQLEEELGVELFYRHGRGIRPTEEGGQFEATVTPLMRDLAQARTDLRAAAKVPAGEIAFGMPPSLSTVIGADLVRDFRTRFPQVRLHIIDGFSGFVNEWLVDGRVDMAVVNNARRSPYVRMDTLLTVDLFLLGQRAAIETLAPDDTTIPTPRLAGLPLILPGRHHGLRRELDAAATRLGFELDVLVEIDSLAALKDLVRGGSFMSVLPHGAIQPEAANPAFGVRRLAAPDLTMEFMIAYSLQRPTTVAMRELARTVRAEVARAVAEGRLPGRLPA